jgi:N utilization substance protein A
MSVQSDFSLSVNQIASERGINIQEVLEAVSEAISAAYRREYNIPEDDEIKVKMDSENGGFMLYVNGKEVVSKDFGRIASQTARQVILQKVNEAERDTLMEQFKDKIGTIAMGVVQRFDGQNVIIEIGKILAILPPEEQIYGELLRPGSKIKVYLKEIQEVTPGVKRLIVSRSSDLVIKSLFENEIPEIASKTVEIKGIAREAGSRSKVAVFSDSPGIDPIGACVGQRGIRIMSMTNELGNEKIDIIQYDNDIEKFIKNSLSPAKPTKIVLDKENKEAKVIIPEDQLSLAIGKEGQNVRLAAKLTEYKIDIEGEGGTKVEEKQKEENSEKIENE